MDSIIENQISKQYTFMDNNSNTPTKANLMKKEIGRFVLYKELSKYYTADQIDQMLVDIATHGTIDLNRYVKKSEVDSALSPTSEMPVQNKVIYEKLMDYYDKEQIDEMLSQGGHIVDPTPTKDSPNAVSSGGVYDVTHGTLKTRYIPFDLRGESILFLSDDDMTELFGPATMVGGQSMFDLTVGEYQHIYRVTNSKSEVFEIPAAYYNANGVRKIVGINGNLTIELSFTITNGVYVNAAIAKRETSIPGISYEEEQDLTPAQRRTAQQNIGLEKDVAGGVAGLDASGKIVEQQIPTDVVDGANLGSTSIQFGASQQLTSTEQVYAQNNMMGKTYNADTFSGLGKKVLAKNIQTVSGVQKNVLTQAFFQDDQGNALTNTTFVIQFDFDLNGETINIPSNSILLFDGGSIRNGVLMSVSSGFDISASLYRIFDNVSIQNHERPLHSKWFCYADGVTDDTTNLQNFFNSSTSFIIDEGIHRFTSTITLSKYIQICGSSIASKYTDCCLYFDKNTTGKALFFEYYGASPYVSIKGIHIKGNANTNQYFGYYSNTYCIDVSNNPYSVNLEVEDCWFEHFEYIFYTNPNSYYNTFNRCRIDHFGYVFYNFDANNFKLTDCRILYGNTVFKAIAQTGAAGPLTIDKCAIEQVYYILYTSAHVRRVNFTNNYVEITDKNIPLSLENFLFYGYIDNFTSLNNELQVNSVFRIYWMTILSFVSIGNHFVFNLTNTKVKVLYQVQPSTVFIAEDSFDEMPASSAEQYSYEAFPVQNTEMSLPGNCIVQAIEPVSKKLFSSSGTHGTTANRPSNVNIGFIYLDESLSPARPIWYKGNDVWVDATGTTV